MSEPPPFSLRIGRRVVQLPLIVWLVALWQLMWDRVSVANLLSGLAVALVLVLVFPLPPLDPGLRLRPLGLVRFLARFAADLLRSAGPLTWQAFGSADRHMISSVVGVTLRTRSDLILTVMAIALSAVPGTLVVDVRRGTSTLFLHILGADHDAAVDKARRDVLKLERRVVRAFGTRDDLRAITGETP